ncbi:glycosyl transferase, group 2 family protein [Coccidioides posadasii C735 delta SOWgp]|uniref:dolichyl-phosphate beta-glucosyltransferase n=2 Tax=Coccidioides posadasii TaxID=199306 RepID=A0A0J6FCF1_COCPO|nr:glycosyl transferase, group 2 family protein [Coccidioides posadasii C735 delta SOWgp]EER27221.1 glycosyl transferase, group 2 family protein [Coccidioides posadasii C735 delta SOWgp]KMM66970.1 hypothetical protein CPAG_03306 [Coccidioides posadasii RMSCC 3488]|eukprot:XP_003069366.1 glycosyl transferase, group 2 family protein [Coccidioides posadasii C735 delta SOWgp]
MDVPGFRDVCLSCAQAVIDIPLPYLIGFVVSTLIGLTFLGYTLIFLLAPVPRPPFPEEKTYQTIAEDGSITPPKALPCWYDRIGAQPSDDNRSDSLEDAELFMSVVVPAYNEQERLPGMLEEAVNYLERAYGTLTPHINGLGKRENPKQDRIGTTRKRKTNNVGTSEGLLKGWEIIIVSDGSTDKTIDTALSFARDHQLSLHPKGHAGPWTSKLREGVHIPPGTIRAVTLKQNRGKGGAVTHGMRHVRGKYVVFADADGASNFNDLGKLVQACQQAEDSELRGVAVGSRAHLVGSDAVVKRSKLRNFLMHAFHITIRLLTPPRTAQIKDTQCGFKLFSRASLPYIVPYMHSEGWIFDVEMLMLAEFANIPVVEVPVGWREVKGSKLNVVWDSLGMAWGLAMLRVAWGSGVYRRRV